MTSSSRKVTCIAAMFLILAFGFAAYFRPRYFTDETYLGGLILLEGLLAAVWMYRRFFFPVLILAFLLAGIDFPLASVWTAARWLFLAVGAVVGFLIIVKERRFHFGLFHVAASCAVLSALASASFSQYRLVAIEKAFSLLLLFLYASTGARVAVARQDARFFGGLLIGCEVFVGVVAILYLAGIEIMGNPNSLGAVMGVVGAPILLWGVLLGGGIWVRHRRFMLYVICMYLAFHSQARAGWAAALVSSALLCIGLRKYKLATQGLVAVIVLVTVSGIVNPDALNSITVTAIYKAGDPEHSVFASRKSPWRTATDNIREHPWFGMGLGTTLNATGAVTESGLYSSNSLVTAENGSSYLSILSGVGVLGGIPILLLLIILLRKIVQTIHWMRTFRTPWHPAIPLAMVIVAGVIHATFEDWMFAPGNYLCIFFWSLAFVFVDLAPASPYHAQSRAHVSAVYGA